MSLGHITRETTNARLATTILELNDEGYRVISSTYISKSKLSLVARRFFADEIELLHHPKEKRNIKLRKDNGL